MCAVTYIDVTNTLFVSLKTVHLCAYPEGMTKKSAGVKRQIIFPRKMDDRMKRVKAETGQTPSSIARDAVDKWLDEYDARKKGADRRRLE